MFNIIHILECPCKVFALLWLLLVQLLLVVIYFNLLICSLLLALLWTFRRCLNSLGLDILLLNFETVCMVLLWVGQVIIATFTAAINLLIFACFEICSKRIFVLKREWLGCIVVFITFMPRECDKLLSWVSNDELQCFLIWSVQLLFARRLSLVLLLVTHLIKLLFFAIGLLNLFLSDRFECCWIFNCCERMCPILPILLLSLFPQWSILLNDEYVKVLIHLLKDWADFLHMLLGNA